MNYKMVKSFNAFIYCGTKNNDTGKIHTIAEARSICQKYVDRAGWCVSVNETTYIYSNGKEPGVIVGIINYPRFPDSSQRLKAKTFELANLLKKTLEQKRVSIVIENKTYMIGNGND